MKIIYLGEGHTGYEKPTYDGIWRNVPACLLTKECSEKTIPQIYPSSWVAYLEKVYHAPVVVRSTTFDSPTVAEWLVTKPTTANQPLNSGCHLSSRIGIVNRQYHLTYDSHCCPLLLGIYIEYLSLFGGGSCSITAHPLSVIIGREQTHPLLTSRQPLACQTILLSPPFRHLLPINLFPWIQTGI